LVTRVILATGHLAQKVREHYGHEYLDLPIAYSQETAPLGTAGAILQAMRNFDLSSPFLILNGDSFVDADLSALVELLEQRRDCFALTLFGVNTHPVSGTHASLVHALLSSHGGIGVKTHPVAGSHVSVVHALLSLHMIGVLEQTANAQLSAVQAF
jgi:hypothetical protein